METEVTETFDISEITEQQVRQAIRMFIGEIEQVPPMFSAKKIDGKKAYEFARQGTEKQLKANKVTIYTYEITRIEMPEIDFRVVCSKGTYIRSLAHDLGVALNNGAYLKSLRRTAIGNFRVSDAKSVEQWVDEIREAEMKTID